MNYEEPKIVSLVEKKISNSTKKEEKHLNRNNSAKNIKRSELNLFNKDYKNNIKNDKQVFVNSFLF